MNRAEACPGELPKRFWCSACALCFLLTLTLNQLPFLIYMGPFSQREKNQMPWLLPRTGLEHLCPLSLCGAGQDSATKAISNSMAFCVWVLNLGFLFLDQRGNRQSWACAGTSVVSSALARRSNGLTRGQLCRQTTNTHGEAALVLLALPLTSHTRQDSWVLKRRVWTLKSTRSLVRNDATVSGGTLQPRCCLQDLSPVLALFPLFPERWYNHESYLLQSAGMCSKHSLLFPHF